MSLPRQASIHLRNGESEWRFDWSGFDGDDGFQSFRITVTEQGKARQFDFGGAVVWSLRKLNRFFKDSAQESVQGGFRNPDVMFYDVLRKGPDFLLVISRGPSHKQEEFYLKQPEMFLDREFMPKYDEDKL